jgi:hypothetical protein
MLYRSTDCRCRRGAAVLNLAHSASFHSREKTAPSNPGIKQLAAKMARIVWTLLRHGRVYEATAVAA